MQKSGGKGPKSCEIIKNSVVCIKKKKTFNESTIHFEDFDFLKRGVSKHLFCSSSVIVTNLVFKHGHKVL